MNKDQQILLLIKAKGPILPTEIAKDIGEDILFTSAFLSDLVSRKEIKMSSMSIGGSPLYYFIGQESVVQQRLFLELNEKDQKSVQLLRLKGVLRERDLDPLTTVSLRQLPDFCKPLRVTTNNQRELFYKWDLVELEKAKQLISELLEETQRKVQEEKDKIIASQKKVEDDKLELERVAREKEIQNQEEIQKSEVLEQKEQTPIIIKKTPVKIKLKRESVQKAKQIALPEQSLENPKESKVKQDDFMKLLKMFCKEKDMNIHKIDVLKKGTDINLILEVPSVMGRLRYFAKARKKKTCNENDLSGAFVQGEKHNLPTLFLYTEKLTKSGRELALSGQLKGFLAQRIEL